MADRQDAADEQDRRTAVRVGVAAASLVGAIVLTAALAARAESSTESSVPASDALPQSVSPSSGGAGETSVPTAATPAPPQTQGQTTPSFPVTRSSGSGCGKNTTQETSPPTATAAPSPSAAQEQRQAMPPPPMTHSRGS
ncbi:hypothetical protein ABZ078_33025 [Streptomyces sp. NPDC006385]|uniref:hypothetical protein n=1 Tax=Streptomyces sp. NPDC006385 TaxID=3156761 RepID=UPI0033AB4F05